MSFTHTPRETYENFYASLPTYYGAHLGRSAVCVVQDLGGESAQIEGQLIEGMDNHAKTIQLQTETMRLGLKLGLNVLVHKAEGEVANQVYMRAQTYRDVF